MCRCALAGIVLLAVGLQLLPQGFSIVGVILPEEKRCIVPRLVPNPACETGIIRAFLSYAFQIVYNSRFNLYSLGRWRK